MQGLQSHLEKHYISSMPDGLVLPSTTMQNHTHLYLLQSTWVRVNGTNNECFKRFRYQNHTRFRSNFLDTNFLLYTLILTTDRSYKTCTNHRFRRVFVRNLHVFQFFVIVNSRKNARASWPLTYVSAQR